MISSEAPGPFDKESVTIARVGSDRRKVSSTGVDEKKTNGRSVRNPPEENSHDPFRLDYCSSIAPAVFN